MPRLFQAKSPLALTPRTLQRRWTGKSFFAASTRPNPIDFPPWRKKSRPSSGSRAPAEDFSFSRRNRFNSAAISSCRSGGGASRSRSRVLSIHRRSVERQIPRSVAISFCVRPFVSTSRTASASKSRVNRRRRLPMKCSSFPQKSPPLFRGNVHDGAPTPKAMTALIARAQFEFMIRLPDSLGPRSRRRRLAPRRRSARSLDPK